MSVCLSLSWHISKPHVQTSRNFLYMLPVAVARSSSDDSIISYVLPVLCMTSCFHIHIIWHIWCRARFTAETCQSAGGNVERGGASALQLRPSLRCLPLTDIPRPYGLLYTTEFGCGCEQLDAHPGAKSVIFDCLVDDCILRTM